MKLYISYFIIFIYTITHCFSQDPFYINYTIDDGLPSNEVYDVEIDNNGILWFTTDRGVCSYDSYQFTTYTTYDGLGDNVNFEIFKDSDGVLWFFGYNGKITLYDKGVFSMYQYNDILNAKAKTISGNYIKEVIQGKDGKLYVCCNNQIGKNIFYFDRNTEPQIKTVDNSKREYKIEPYTFLFNRTVGSNFSEHAISLESESTAVISKFKSDINIEFIYQEKNTIWFADRITQGIQKMNLTNNHLDTILTDYNITNIKKDYNEGYWISTANKGVIFISNIHSTSMDLNLLTNSKTNYFKLHSFSGYLFCGISNSNVIIIDSAKIAQEKSLKINLLNQNIDEFQTINNGKTLRINSHDIEITKGKRFSKSLITTKKSFLTSNDEILIRNRTGCSIIRNNFNDTIQLDLDEKVTKVLEDKKSNIWIGTLNGVHLIKDFNYNNPIPIKTNDNNDIGRVSDLTLDSNNNIWISTIGNGFFIKPNGRIIHFNSDNGLTSNIVNTLEVTKDNQIWIATNNGLNLITYKDSLENLSFIEAFDQSDGLNSNYINDVILWNKKIYVASPNGICYFDPSKITKSSSEIPLSINSVFVNEAKVSQDSLLEFRHFQNKINIKYTAIRHNKSSEQLLYKYSLTKNNQPKTWNFINDREVIFDNLTHGEYIFEVNAVNKFGEWNESSTKLSFSILPHYADTIWFKTILFLFGLISLFLIGLYFLRRYQQRKNTELALEEARTRAKEAELSALRNQMNPHFIFNSLNTIQNFIFKKDVRKANYLLSKFSSLIRKSLNYSRLEAITISEEIEFLQDYVELEKVRFPDLIIIEFKIDKKVDTTLDCIPSLILQPLIENSIKHGISKSTQTGKISVIFEALDNSYLKITISNASTETIERQQTNKNHISLGHQILKDRIEILKSKGYPISSFNVEDNISSSTPNYKVTLILPKL